MSKITNFFDIFDIEISSKIDVGELEKKYYQFQLQFHPDRLDKSNTNELEKSILINQGYKILSDDLSRLIHILQLHDIDLNDDEKMIKTDQATLFEILNLQEEIDQSEESEKQNFKKNLKEKLKNLIDLTAEQIEQKKFLEAAQILIKAKYYNKILQDLKNN